MIAVECMVAHLTARASVVFVVIVARVPVKGEVIRRQVGCTNHWDRYEVLGVELNGNFNGSVADIAAFVYVEQKPPVTL